MAVSGVLLNPEVEDSDCRCAVQLMECVMLNCRGRVDGWIEPFLRVAGQRLATAEETFLKARASAHSLSCESAPPFMPPRWGSSASVRQTKELTRGTQRPYVLDTAGLVLTLC